MPIVCIPVHTCTLTCENLCFNPSWAHNSYIPVFLHTMVPPNQQKCIPWYTARKWPNWWYIVSVIQQLSSKMAELIAVVLSQIYDPNLETRRSSRQTSHIWKPLSWAHENWPHVFDHVKPCLINSCSLNKAKCTPVADLIVHERTLFKQHHSISL